MDKITQALQPFVIGGASGMLATCIIQPIDMIKVLLQVESEAKRGQGKISVIEITKKAWKNQGIKGFYRGIDSALARQFFYTTIRLGIYKTAIAATLEKNKKKGKSTHSLIIDYIEFYQRALCATIAGLVGAFAGNPADLVLIRMQADANLPETERRNYRNVFNAFSRITKEEGIQSLWRGSTPTLIRAVVLNLTMLTSYDMIKEELQSMWHCAETVQVRLIGSAIAGCLAACASLPFDNAKTKIQKMKKDANGNYPYKNIFDAMIKTVKNQGALNLWVGLSTFAIRIAPHACITLLLQDKFTDLANLYRNRNH